MSSRFLKAGREYLSTIVAPAVVLSLVLMVALSTVNMPKIQASDFEPTQDLADVNAAANARVGVSHPVPTSTAYVGQVAAGVPQVATLQVPSEAGTTHSFLAQVQVAGAASAGAMQVHTPGSASSTSEVAFPAGDSSTSLLVKTDDASQVQIAATVSAKIVIQITGYFGEVEGVDIPAPGGTKLVDPVAVVDTTQSIGQDASLQLEPEVSLPVLGLGDLPSVDRLRTNQVRSVWLSVATLGVSSGELRFSAESNWDDVMYEHCQTAEACRVSALSAPVEANKWSTSLLSVPVGEDGQIKYYAPQGLTGLKIAALGYTAMPTHTEGAVVNGGFTPTFATDLPREELAEGLTVATLNDETNIPMNARSIWISAKLTCASAAPCKAIFGQSEAEASSAAYFIDVPAGVSVTANLQVDVSASGQLFMRLGGATLERFEAYGYAAPEFQPAAQVLSGSESATAVTFDAPQSSQNVDLAATPMVTLTGTVENSVVGVRSLSLYAQSEFIGAAKVDNTTHPATWQAKVLGQPGNSHITAVAQSSAGDVSVASTDVYAAPLAENVGVMNWDTILINGEAGHRITQVKDDYLVFAGNTPLKTIATDRAGVPLPGNPLHTVAPGDVIIEAMAVLGEDDKSYMRRVVSIEYLYTKTVVNTVKALQDDAVMQAEAGTDGAQTLPVNAANPGDQNFAPRIIANEPQGVREGAVDALEYMRPTAFTSESLKNVGANQTAIPVDEGQVLMRENADGSRTITNNESSVIPTAATSDDDSGLLKNIPNLPSGLSPQDTRLFLGVKFNFEGKVELSSNYLEALDKYKAGEPPLRMHQLQDDDDDDEGESGSEGEGGGKKKPLGKFEVEGALGVEFNVQAQYGLDLQIKIGIKWKWGFIPLPTIKYYKYERVEQKDNQVSVYLDAMGKVEIKFDFPPIKLPIIAFSLGPVPIIIIPALEPTVSLTFSVGGGKIDSDTGMGASHLIEFGRSEKNESRKGQKYEDGVWTPIEVENNEPDARELKVGVSLRISLEMGIQFSLLVYGLFGPYVGIKFEISFTAGFAYEWQMDECDPERDPNRQSDPVRMEGDSDYDYAWSKGCGKHNFAVAIQILIELSVEVGVKIEVLGWTLFDVHKTWSLEPIKLLGPHGKCWTITFKNSNKLCGEAQGDSDTPKEERAVVNDGPGSVVSFGANDLGQLGNSARSGRSRYGFSSVSNLFDAQEVAANANSGYALMSDGTVSAWGDNAYGQLGVSTVDQAYATVPVQVQDDTGAPLRSIAHIYATENTAYALTYTGELYAWGSNNCGLLGINWQDGICGSTGAQFSSAAKKVPGLIGISEMSTNRSSVIVRQRDNLVFGWGKAYGAAHFAKPTRINIGELAGKEILSLQVADGLHTPDDSPCLYALVREAEGDIYKNNIYDSLLGADLQASTPTLHPYTLPEGVTISQFAAVNGVVYTIDSNDIVRKDTDTPTLVPNLNNVTLKASSIKVVDHGSTATVYFVAYFAQGENKGQTGRLVTCGENLDFQAGHASPIPENTCQMVLDDAIKGVSVVGAGDRAAYAVRTMDSLPTDAGRIWGYGNSIDAQIGRDTKYDTLTLVDKITADAKKVVAGAWTTYSLMRDGTVLAWGDNVDGQLGFYSSDQQVDYRNAPATVPGMTDVSELVAGDSFAVASQNDGDVYAWGTFGRDGENDVPLRTITDDDSLPLKVSFEDRGTDTCFNPKIAANNYTAFIFCASAAGGTDGKIYAIGEDVRAYNENSPADPQIALGSRITGDAPTLEAKLLFESQSVKSLAAPSNALVWLDSAGKAHGVGTNVKGVLGSGIADSTLQATPALLKTVNKYPLEVEGQHTGLCNGRTVEGGTLSNATQITCENTAPNTGELGSVTPGTWSTNCATDYTIYQMRIDTYKKTGCELKIKVPDSSDLEDLPTAAKVIANGYSVYYYQNKDITYGMGYIAGNPIEPVLSATSDNDPFLQEHDIEDQAIRKYTAKYAGTTVQPDTNPSLYRFACLVGVGDDTFSRCLTAYTTPGFSIDDIAASGQTRRSYSYPAEGNLRSTWTPTLSLHDDAGVLLTTKLGQAAPQASIFDDTIRISAGYGTNFAIRPAQARYDYSLKAGPGSISAWGTNSGAVLGLSNPQQNYPSPTRAPAWGSKLNQIVVDDGTAYSVDMDGKLQTSGDEKYGKRTTGYDNSRPVTPITIVDRGTEKKIFKVVAYAGSVFAITDSGELYAWGRNDEGQLGLGEVTPLEDSSNGVSVPQKVEGVQNVKDVLISSADVAEVSGIFVVALTASGKLYTWGPKMWSQNTYAPRFDRRSLVDFPIVDHISADRELLFITSKTRFRMINPSGADTLTVGMGDSDHLDKWNEYRSANQFSNFNVKTVPFAEQGDVKTDDEIVQIVRTDYDNGHHDDTDWRIIDGRSFNIIFASRVNFHIDFLYHSSTITDFKGKLDELLHIVCAGNDDCKNNPPNAKQNLVTAAMKEGTNSLSWWVGKRYEAAGRNVTPSPTSIDKIVKTKDKMFVADFVKGKVWSKNLAYTGNATANLTGALGNGTVNPDETWKQLSVTSVKDISSDGNSVFILDDGTFGAPVESEGVAHIWGENANENLDGDKSSLRAIARGEQSGSQKYALCTAAANVENTEYVHAKKIAGLEGATAILDADGRVYMMGKNTKGQLGVDYSAIPEGDTCAEPLMVGRHGEDSAGQQLNYVKDIAASQNSLFALKQDGTVYAWGDNLQADGHTRGRLGITDYDQFETTSTPKIVYGLRNVIALAANDEAVYAVTANGYVYTWGNVRVSAAGAKTLLHRATLMNDYIGAATFYEVKAAGLKAYGHDTAGAIYDLTYFGSTIAETTTPLNNSTSYEKFAVAPNWLLLQRNGKEFEYNGTNPEGDAPTSRLATAGYLTELSALFGTSTKSVEIAISDHNIYIVDNNGTLYTHGNNTYGQLAVGNNSLSDTTCPVQVTSSFCSITFPRNPVRQVYAYGNTAYALLERAVDTDVSDPEIEGTDMVYTWGKSETTNNLFPEPLSALKAEADGCGGTITKYLRTEDGKFGFALMDNGDVLIDDYTGAAALSGLPTTVLHLPTDSFGDERYGPATDITDIALGGQVLYMLSDTGYIFTADFSDAAAVPSVTQEFPAGGVVTDDDVRALALAATSGSSVQVCYDEACETGATFNDIKYSAVIYTTTTASDAIQVRAGGNVDYDGAVYPISSTPLATPVDTSGMRVWGSNGVLAARYQVSDGQGSKTTKFAAYVPQITEIDGSVTSVATHSNVLGAGLLPQLPPFITGASIADIAFGRSGDDAALSNVYVVTSDQYLYSAGLDAFTSSSDDGALGNPFQQVFGMEGQAAHVWAAGKNVYALNSAGNVYALGTNANAQLGLNLADADPSTLHPTFALAKVATGATFKTGSLHVGGTQVYMVGANPAPVDSVDSVNELVSNGSKVDVDLGVEGIPYPIIANLESVNTTLAQYGLRVGLVGGKWHIQGSVTHAIAGDTSLDVTLNLRNGNGVQAAVHKEVPVHFTIRNVAPTIQASSCTNPAAPCTLRTGEHIKIPLTVSGLPAPEVTLSDNAPFWMNLVHNQKDALDAQGNPTGVKLDEYFIEGNADIDTAVDGAAVLVKANNGVGVPATVPIYVQVSAGLAVVTPDLMQLNVGSGASAQYNVYGVDTLARSVQIDTNVLSVDDLDALDLPACAAVGGEQEVTDVLPLSALNVADKLFLTTTSNHTIVNTALAKFDQVGCYAFKLKTVQTLLTDEEGDEIPDGTPGKVTEAETGVLLLQVNGFEPTLLAPSSIGFETGKVVDQVVTVRGVPAPLLELAQPDCDFEVEVGPGSCTALANGDEAVLNALVRDEFFAKHLQIEKIDPAQCPPGTCTSRDLDTHYYRLHSKGVPVNAAWFNIGDNNAFDEADGAAFYLDNALRLRWSLSAASWSAADATLRGSATLDIPVTYTGEKAQIHPIDNAKNCSVFNPETPTPQVLCHVRVGQQLYIPLDVAGSPLPSVNITDENGDPDDYSYDWMTVDDGPYSSGPYYLVSRYPLTRAQILHISQNSEQSGAPTPGVPETIKTQSELTVSNLLTHVDGNGVPDDPYTHLQVQIEFIEGDLSIDGLPQAADEMTVLQSLQNSARLKYVATKFTDDPVDDVEYDVTAETLGQTPTDATGTPIPVEGLDFEQAPDGSSAVKVAHPWELPHHYLTPTCDTKRNLALSAAMPFYYRCGYFASYRGSYTGQEVRAYDFSNLAPALRAQENWNGLPALRQGTSTAPVVDGGAALPADWATLGVAQYQWYRSVPGANVEEPPAEPEDEGVEVAPQSALRTRALDQLPAQNLVFEPIPGAVHGNYVPTAEDVDKFIKVEVAVNDDQFSGVAASSIAYVYPAPQAPPPAPAPPAGHCSIAGPPEAVGTPELCAAAGGTWIGGTQNLHEIAETGIEAPLPLLALLLLLLLLVGVFARRSVR